MWWSIPIGFFKFPIYIMFNWWKTWQNKFSAIQNRPNAHTLVLFLHGFCLCYLYNSCFPLYILYWLAMCHCPSYCTDAGSGTWWSINTTTVHIYSARLKLYIYIYSRFWCNLCIFGGPQFQNSLYFPFLGIQASKVSKVSLDLTTYAWHILDLWGCISAPQHAMHSPSLKADWIKP